MTIVQCNEETVTVKAKVKSLQSMGSKKSSCSKKLEEIDKQNVTSPFEILGVLDFRNKRGENT